MAQDHFSDPMRTNSSHGNFFVLATYLIPRCVGRVARLGSENVSRDPGGGILESRKSGILEI